MRTGGSALLGAAALLAFSVHLCADLESAAIGAPSDDLLVHPSLIVHNAKIHTMDAALSTHQAMALRGNRIWKLGTNDEILPLAGKDTKVLDARNRTVLPGLIDAHTHPHVWGVLHWGYKYDPQLQWLYVESADAAALKSRLEERLTERIRQAGPGKWIVAAVPRGLTGRGFTGSTTVADLDRLAPDNPVIVVPGLIGAIVVNSKAKEEMVRVLGRDVAAEETVQIWSLVMYDIIMRGRTDAVADLVRREMHELVPLGVTTIMSNISSPQVLRSLSVLNRREQLPVRWAWVHRAGFALAKDPAEFYSVLGDFSDGGNDFFWNIGVGEEGWDNVWCTSLQPLSVPLQQLQRREIDAGKCEAVPGTRLYEGHLAAARNGLRLADMHMYADMALDGAVQIAETLIREKRMTLEEIRAQKWGFDHAYLLPPDSAKTFAKYGFWMSFQARAITREDRIGQTYGTQYLPWVLPVKAWLDAGARFTLNTDAHVTLGTSREEVLQDEMIGKGLWDFWPDEWRNSIWPWLGVWVTREVNGKSYSPEKKLDRTTVLKAWTVWPAEFVSRSNDLGSLEPGKLGDFVVIDRDYFTIPEPDIARIKTLATVVDGHVRFTSPEF
jgi:predicted amidohydrolase YtcJ